jgi:hypothetical protein
MFPHVGFFHFSVGAKSMHAVIQPTLVENRMLQYLVEGLRLTLAWEFNEKECRRKVATLRFIAHCFQRHMERLIALEECGGYMNDVLARSPKLEKSVAALRQDHEYFRKETTRIIQALETVSPSGEATFARISEDLGVLLKKVDRHHGKEVDVFEEAFEREEGGEG